MIALERHIFAQTPMTKLAEWPKLLRPVAWHSAADREDSQLFLAQQSGSKMLQILEGIKPDLVPSGRLAKTVVQSCVQSQFRVAEGGYENWHALFVGGLQDSPLPLGVL